MKPATNGLVVLLMTSAAACATTATQSAPSGGAAPVAAAPGAAGTGEGGEPGQASGDQAPATSDPTGMLSTGAPDPRPSTGITDITVTTDEAGNTRRGPARVTPPPTARADDAR